MLDGFGLPRPRLSRLRYRDREWIGRPGRDEAAYDVVATTDLTICCFRKRPFEALMEKTPHIGQRLLEMTLDELDAAL